MGLFQAYRLRTNLNEFCNSDENMNDDWHLTIENVINILLKFEKVSEIIGGSETILWPLWKLLREQKESCPPPKLARLNTVDLFGWIGKMFVPIQSKTYKKSFTKYVTLWSGREFWRIWRSIQIKIKSDLYNNRDKEEKRSWKLQFSRDIMNEWSINKSILWKNILSIFQRQKSFYMYDSLLAKIFISKSDFRIHCK